jgi:MFS transporter, ACS family, hexuronate transporter
MFLTLLAAMSIQWIGNQSAVFVWAGLMHPLALLVFWFVLGRDFKMAEVDTLLDMTKKSRPLIIAGTSLIVVGLALTGLIYANWAASVKAASLAGAAQALTAAIGVALIGGVLFYAGQSRKPAVIGVA